MGARAAMSTAPTLGEALPAILAIANDGRPRSLPNGLLVNATDAVHVLRVHDAMGTYGRAALLAQDVAAAIARAWRITGHRR